MRGLMVIEDRTRPNVHPKTQPDGRIGVDDPVPCRVAHSIATEKEIPAAKLRYPASIPIRSGSSTESGDHTSLMYPMRTRGLIATCTRESRSCRRRSLASIEASVKPTGLQRLGARATLGG